MRNDDPVAGLGEQRRHIDKAMDVVGPAVQQDDDGAVGRTVLGIAYIEHAGIDLLQRGERRVIRRRGWRRYRGLRLRPAAEDERCCRDTESGGAEKLAAIAIDLFGYE